jgi:large subunit ribosomal protein L21
MYAIVEMQGQQFNVEAGQKVCVLRLANAEAGKEVTFENVLLVNKEGAITVGTPTVAGAKVVCEIVQPLVKGKKLIVFHKKRRKGFDKKTGSRQHFTEVLVKEIVA